jgi:hypothetical protein
MLKELTIQSASFVPSEKYRGEYDLVLAFKELLVPAKFAGFTSTPDTLTIRLIEYVQERHRRIYVMRLQFDELPTTIFHGGSFVSKLPLKNMILNPTLI